MMMIDAAAAVAVGYRCGKVDRSTETTDADHVRRRQPNQGPPTRAVRTDKAEANAKAAAVPRRGGLRFPSIGFATCYLTLDTSVGRGRDPGSTKGRAVTAAVRGDMTRRDLLMMMRRRCTYEPHVPSIMLLFLGVDAEVDGCWSGRGGAYGGASSCLVSSWTQRPGGWIQRASACGFLLPAPLDPSVGRVNIRLVPALVEKCWWGES
jgi:hypothetical protein